PPRFLGNPKVTAPTSKDPGGTALPGRYRRAGTAPACAHGRGSHDETNFGAEWAGSGHTLSTLRPAGHPAGTQDSLPAVGQTLPGGLPGPLGSSERFLRCFLHRFPPFPGLPWRKRASVRHGNGTSLIPFRAIVLQLGNDSRLCEWAPRPPSAFPRPRFPASWAVANPVVCHGRQHCLDQRVAVLRPGRLNLRSERGQDLLGSFETNLARHDAMFASGHGHDGAE